MIVSDQSAKRVRKGVPVLIACLTLLAISASAATIPVPSIQPTIQAAVDVAGEGDTILIAAGTYSGAGNENIGIIGKGLVIRSESGAESTILEATEPARTFLIDSNNTHTVTIEGLTISGGYKYDFQTSYDKRGGVQLTSGTLILQNCIMTGCFNPLKRAARGCDMRSLSCAPSRVAAA